MFSRCYNGNIVRISQLTPMAHHKHSLQPAHQVITRFGGCRPLARVLAVHPSTISRWATPSFAKGTDGRIPQRYWGRLIVAAQERGISLTVNHLAGM